MNDTANITGIYFSRLTLQQTVDLVAGWAFPGSQPSSPRPSLKLRRAQQGLPLLPVVAFRNLKASLCVAEPQEDRGWWVVNCTLLDGVPLIDNGTVHR